MTGAVLIDKPSGFTSFDVIAVMRRVLGTRRLGHTGTLDPMATGVLPLLVGKATRLADLLPTSDKGYSAMFRLGMTTDTLDITGRVLTNSAVTAGKIELENVIASFRGDIHQTPPMYSAKKVGGVRLYDMARNGREIERRPVPVTIKRLELTGWDETAHEYCIDVLCTKGTYIRSLVDDIGRALGCGAVLTSLRRTLANGITADSCLTLDEARHHDPDELIIPVDRLLSEYTPLTVTQKQATRFTNGGELSRERIELPTLFTQYLRIYSPCGQLLGLGEAGTDAIRVKCLLTENENA